MDGDPWYLSGTDLELAEGLLVHGISYLNTTLPYDTLLYDLEVEQQMEMVICFKIYLVKILILIIFMHLKI